MSDHDVRPKVLAEPTTFRSWSQTKSIYYEINRCWTLEDFQSMRHVNEGRNRLVHPYFTSNNINVPELSHIRFYLKLYPCGHDRPSQKRAQLYLHYETDGTENAKVYMNAHFVQANTTCFISPLAALKCVMKPNTRKIMDNLVEHTTLDMDAGNGYKFDTLNIQMKVFIGTEQLVSLQYLPKNAEERAQLGIHYRREVVSDLVNFLDREVNIHLNAKAILDNGYKVLLGALLPFAIHDIRSNFDDFFNSNLGRISAESLNELFRFLFNGDRPRSDSQELETAARKLNIVSLVNVIEKAQQKKRKSKSSLSSVQDDDDHHHQEKRQKSDNNKLTLSLVNNKLQVNPTEVAGPSGLGSSALVTAPPSGKPAKTTPSKKLSGRQLSGKRPKVKKPETSSRVVLEHFTLDHAWSISDVVTDPTKDKLIESPKFYPPNNKHVKFSLSLKMPKKGKTFISFSATAHLEGYEEIEVECFVSAKEIWTLSGPFRTKKLLKDNDSVCIPYFIEKDNCCVLRDWKYNDNDKDILYIHCKIKVKLFQPRPVVEEALSKTGFNSLTLVNKLEALLGSGVFADFELRVGEQLKVFRAHRAILFARSEALRDMYHDLGNRGGEFKSVEYRNLAPAVMKDILLHMYTGKCPPARRMSEQMCKAAHVLKLNTLHNECVNALANTFSVEKIIGFLERAHLNNDEELKHKCFDYWFEHSEWLDDEPEWEPFLVKNVPLMVEYMDYIHDKDVSH